MGRPGAPRRTIARTALDIRAARQTRERYLVDEAVTLSETSATMAEPVNQPQTIMFSTLGEAYSNTIGSGASQQ